MGTLRAKTLLYPGAYGLNTLEPTLTDEELRFGVAVTNGVVDSAGRLAARANFALTSTPTGRVIDKLHLHDSSFDADILILASSGLILSGLTTFTTEENNTIPRQLVDVGAGATNATVTGLANDATTYGLTVSVNGAAAQQVTVTGSAAQSYSALITEINNDLTGASCALFGSNLQFSGNTVGSGTILVANTAGTASVALLSSLASFAALRVARTGTLTNNYWQFASFNGVLFGALKNQDMSVQRESAASTFTQASIIGQPWSNSVNCVMAAYGRLWAADDETGLNRNTLYWSNLLDGRTWNSGDAGNLNLRNAWPQGEDDIIALAAAFSRMIILGRRNVLMYTMPANNDPSGLTLTDVIENLGCAARDSVQVTDEGVYFLSDNGIYRIDKLTQTTSLMDAPPKSILCNDLILASIAAETNPARISSAYYPQEGYYLLHFPTSNVTYAVMTRHTVPHDDIENLSPVLTWTNVGAPFLCFATNQEGDLYCGGSAGIHTYGGYVPDDTPSGYDLVFTGQWHPFEDESRLKHGKSVVLVVEAASGQTGTFEWRTDYLTGTVRSNAFTCSATEFAENPGIGNVPMQIGGSFHVIQPSVTFPITSAKVTLHQIRLYAAPGAVKIG